MNLRNDTGASLVIILAFIVLLTVLVLAYFSYSSLQRQISQASASQAAAEVFAKGAVNTIIGDLRQEILAGSTNISTNSSYPVYYPVKATTMVPALSGFSTNAGLENVVKVSRSGSNFFSGTNYNTTDYPSTNRAAQLSTTAASQNGRYLSLDRWNAALLLGKNNTNSATDLTPANFTAPDWILVARNGSNPTSWNANMRWSATSSSTVVGRFAYVIYDEGGLLDMNAAGFPPGSDTNLVASKGSLATADLSVIPGMTADAISALVGWRNFVTGGASGSFPGYSFSTAGQSNYFETMRTNTVGFLRTANTSLSGGKSDRMFVSRQQLIQFLTQGVAGSAAEKAALQNSLRYLGTFSRDLEQPSFRPDPNRPKNTLSPNIGVTGGTPGIGNGNDAFSTDGSIQDAVNPALLTVRGADGEPVLKRRFPLSRLALLKPNPSSADAAKIKDYFGLSWDSANNYWIYDHGNPTKILRLSEVPAGREPDFFEILKAAIHVDSLGKQFGGLDSPATPHGQNGITVEEQRMYDGETQSQIARIAANIIDQYDEDSYPTAINFSGRNFYGVENLPYLAGWQQMWYRLRHLTAADIAPDAVDEKGDEVSFLPPDAKGNRGNVFPYESAVMIQPIIWNPHAPDTRTNPPDVPTEFRVYAGGTANNARGDIDYYTTCHAEVARDWWASPEKTVLTDTFPASDTYATATGMTPVSDTLYRFPDATINPSKSILTFNTGVGAAAFQEPYRLRAPDFPSGSNASNDQGYPAGRLTVNDATLVAADGGLSTVIGFFCGKAWTGPCISSDNTQKWLSYGRVSVDLKLTLQYKKGGSWYTYDVIPNVFNLSSNTSTVDNTDDNMDILPNIYIRTFRTCLRADPRTNRWGLFHLATWPSVNSSDVPAGLDFLGDNGVDQVKDSKGNTNVKHPRYILPQGITWKPSATSSYRAQGTANGPAAPGWINPSLWNPADLMVNLARTPNGNPNSGTSTSATPGAKYYYADPDGVVRRASGWNFSGSDGLPLYTGNTDSRPVVLNRPFRSVAELGYVFRDIAWKNLDVFAPESADTALLDVFCLNELDNAPDDVTVAGRVNLNTRQPKVLEALISGVSKAEGGVLTSTEAAGAAKKLVDWTTDGSTTSSGISLKGPLRNRGELIGKYITNTPYASPPNLSGYQNPILNPETTFRGFASELTSGGVFSASADRSIPRRTESVIRALADAGNTRTWNLLVDLVAQVGRYPDHATSLDQFVVEGETRFWVHLAIDRLTGKIIAEQWEAVSE
ncbi:MAG: hypothetical protein BGO12_20115 [Verrucomicrobia bacterium 61-8]|nr:hypothetical protein [Verrucomicrobiota bacterium]OJV17426.1 MAG: hypothetical protein BGO12_20115 [Verrucomicrobia bacterium 61-8]